DPPELHPRRPGRLPHQRGLQRHRPAGDRPLRLQSPLTTASYDALVSTAPDAQRASSPATRLILPVGVFALGLGGFLFLPNYLLYRGCTATWLGHTGLPMYLPMASSRKLPPHAAAL